MQFIRQKIRFSPVVFVWSIGKTFGKLSPDNIIIGLTELQLVRKLSRLIFPSKLTYYGK